MSRETNRAECVNILGEDTVAQIERGIVERHRQLHSDSEMWAMLNQREERMASLMKTIGKVGTMLSVDSLSDNEAKMWRGQRLPIMATFLARLRRSLLKAQPAIAS
jgi:hypothetical protein